MFSRPKVHKVSWWMAHYGGTTPKRHLALSNSATIRKLDLGRLRGWTSKARSKEREGMARVQTTRKYRDKHGKARYHGLPALKRTETLSL